MMASTSEVPAHPFSPPRHSNEVDLDSAKRPDPAGSLSPSSAPLVRKLEQTAFDDRHEHGRQKRRTVSRSPTAGPVASGSGGSAMDVDVGADEDGVYSSLSQGASQLQSALLRAPIEIVHRVLWCSAVADPPSLASAARTCKSLRSYIYNNPEQTLWRDVHLQMYDDPRRAGAFAAPRTDIDWAQRVRDRQLVQSIMQWPPDRWSELPAHLDLICDTLLDMYLDLPASPHPDEPSPLAREETANSAMLEEMLRSDVFKHMAVHLSTRETRPLLRPLSEQPGNPNRRSRKEVINPKLSRLHALLPPEFSQEIVAHRHHRGFLREVVYNSANYQQRNEWAPLTPDGKVDWVLVDAIASVMMANARDVWMMGEDTWLKAVSPLSYGLEPVRGWGFNDLRRPESDDGRVWDWAGVTGRWYGSYAFVDYADWIALNEPRLIQLRRQMNNLDLSRYHEALGDLMHFDLVIDDPPTTVDGSASSSRAHTPTHVEHDHFFSRSSRLSPPRSDDGEEALSTSLPTCDLLPPIYFHGRSAQQSGSLTYPAAAPMTSIRGVVRLTADDPPQVRWTVMIRYGGEDRWKLECVQLGGRGSKRGYVGIWTDAAKEEHTPNGPVWYWKP